MKRIQSDTHQFTVESFDYADTMYGDLVPIASKAIKNAQELVEYLFNNPASHVQFVYKRD